MELHRTAGVGGLAMGRDKLDKVKLAGFREALHCQGIDTGSWGVGGTKSLEHLFWEAYHQRGCILTGVNELGKLKRVTRLLKLTLISEIYGVDHVLFSRLQFMHDGQNIQRKQIIVRKLKWVKDLPDNPSCQDSFSAERCEHTEDFRAACVKALQERLGLSEKWQQQHLQEEQSAYTYTVEDNGSSNGYPGLKTMYCIHSLQLRVLDPERVRRLGLPRGEEFATSESDFTFHARHNEDGLPIGSQLNIWMWERATRPPAKQGGSLQNPKKQVKLPAPEPTAPTPKAPSANQQAEVALRLQKRVPLPAVAVSQSWLRLQRNMGITSEHPPNGKLWAAMGGRKTDWSVIKRMARSITDPKYNLESFHQDLTAFPELNLYLLEEVHNPVLKCSVSLETSSGRTQGDEYQRTVGAFFAIYWLMRLEVDGKDGFTFGVDSNWVPIKPSAEDKRQYLADTRVNFQKNGKWDYFKRLLSDAGLIERTKWGAWRVVEKRLVSLLALTAIHDIMKMDMLLPEVQPTHAPYHGYSSLDMLSDHDLALAYIMDQFPEILPSFWGLDPVERQSVRNTQCNLCFNHGWFVQAEAPPGAIFTKFRQCLIRNDMSRSRDIALYFVHWLTDLAGAEPTPLGGCEKFVLKFPLPVLNSFLRSFEFVEKIVDHTETEVMEEYLKVRWAEHTPSAGELPSGPAAITKMRLLCMAQMNAHPVLKALGELTPDDLSALTNEMSRTGCTGQSYSQELIPKQVYDRPLGPAFLIYYGPAFLQNLGNDSAVRRLSVLAEIYRCSRQLWPAVVTKVASNVIVRIDTIKSLSTDEILQAIEEGDLWLLVKRNESEAFIDRSSKKKLNTFIAIGQSIQILDFTYISQQY
mmetsp:Transcript_10406/g.32905  ORF Transcript_10406/g.32905 Transcript_10406/m.32905 type:complete len:862 (+) Transcript_10406:290-2875(+)